MKIRYFAATSALLYKDGVSVFMIFKKLTFFGLLTAAVVGSLIAVFLIYPLDSDKKRENVYHGLSEIPIFQKSGNESSPSVAATKYCDFNFQRLKGYKFVKPIVDGEPECESVEYGTLKGEIMSFIENQKNSGFLAYSSVFVKNLATNRWFVINPNQGYHPGSLIKVAVLIAYLKMAENKPDLLNSSFFYGKDATQYPQVLFKSDTIVSGNSYRVKDLLYFMVANSDNHATVLLENNMDMSVFKNVFTDIGLRELNFSDTSYRVFAKSYSNFFSELYNAGYLTINSSEYAASLLSASDFKDGIQNSLPPDEKIAHKFGEWSDGYNKELHEAGIVYAGGNPYLISIMTRGMDWSQLSLTISKISGIVYDVMKPKKRTDKI